LVKLIDVLRPIKRLTLRHFYKDGCGLIEKPDCVVAAALVEGWFKEENWFRNCVVMLTQVEVIVVEVQGALAPSASGVIIREPVGEYCEWSSNNIGVRKTLVVTDRESNHLRLAFPPLWWREWKLMRATLVG
jgi:hypothetical protein